MRLALRFPLTLVVLIACTGFTGCADGAGVSFVEPSDGDTVSSPVHIIMEAQGFKVEPSGPVREDSGHLHLMVDTGCMDTGETIPDDMAHVHLGDGNTETDFPLAPGEHSLCLQAGDGQHAALDLTDEITITVVTTGGEEGEEAAAEDQVWEGTVTGEVTRPGCTPTKVPLDGVVHLSVGDDGEVTGTATEGWGECSVAGGTVPAADNTYRIDGRKTEEAFELTVSGTGVREMTIPITGTRATVTFDEGSAGYEARITYTLDCTTCE